MSFENKGSIGRTIMISAEPDRRGNLVCDGTSDQVEINAAITRLGAEEGGTVFLANGRYNIDAPILMNQPSIYLRGENKYWGDDIPPGAMSAGIFLANGSNCNMITVSGRMCSTMDLFLHGNDDNNVTGTCLYINAGSSMDFFGKDMLIFYSPEDGVYAGGQACFFARVFSEHNGRHSWNIGGEFVQTTDCVAVEPGQNEVAHAMYIYQADRGLHENFLVHGADQYAIVVRESDAQLFNHLMIENAARGGRVL